MVPRYQITIQYPPPNSTPVRKAPRIVRPLRLPDPAQFFSCRGPSTQIPRPAQFFFSRRGQSTITSRQLPHAPTMA